ncbi:two-component system, chemotaxis family, CheB/CheR fusion protein [Cyclobacterium xiamenense]|uniref:histidine kinase n=1 Tax=Cyclobacterium xiamenense TaxID=1297121 RepID=A0A1H7B108_9BACT|nr:ATP-binding protein [Cyclobacterium xiamenense]SEJ71483.1 two-component system, chemotaxis family, CheB/CheR fusion protein [Cyclobacterium xiamenense]
MAASKKISIIYVVIGILWIFGSDKLMLLVGDQLDETQLAQLQLAKGVFFVLLTGLLLYMLIKKQYRYLDRKVKELELTNSKLEEERLKSEHAKNQLDQFILVAANDLAGPVRQSQGFLELFIRKNEANLPDKSMSFLRLTLDNFIRIKGVIQDLVTFSQLSEKETTHEKVDLNEVLEKVIHLNSKKIREHNIHLRKEVLPIVKGDFQRFTQLFDHLLNNAVKFRNPERILRVSVSATRAGDIHTLAVQDNGKGIAPEYLPRIFYVLQRYDDGFIKRGTGMGLAICKKIVEDVGGKIWATSVPGEGSTFFISFKAHEFFQP